MSTESFQGLVERFLVHAQKANIKPFEVILSDPPWPYRNKVAQGAASKHYSAMTEQALLDLPMGQICTADTVLLLWVTYPQTELALKAVNKWRFRFLRVLLLWVKRTKDGKLFAGVGNYTRSNSETLWLCVRQDRVATDPLLHQELNVVRIWESPVGKHSSKPDAVYQFITNLWFPHAQRKLELFARASHEGFVAVGLQLNSSDQIMPLDHHFRTEQLQKTHPAAAVAFQLPTSDLAAVACDGSCENKSAVPKEDIQIVHINAAYNKLAWTATQWKSTLQGAKMVFVWSDAAAESIHTALDLIHVANMKFKTCLFAAFPKNLPLVPTHDVRFCWIGTRRPCKVKELLSIPTSIVNTCPIAKFDWPPPHSPSCIYARPDLPQAIQQLTGQLIRHPATFLDLYPGNHILGRSTVLERETKSVLAAGDIVVSDGNELSLAKSDVLPAAQFQQHQSKQQRCKRKHHGRKQDKGEEEAKEDKEKIPMVMNAARRIKIGLE
jgi:N6-adenosine-specific RNA methylase IME4